MDSTIDLELDALTDPQTPSSEYLSKRVASIITNINLREDEGLKQSLLHLDLEEGFLKANLVVKAKQYDHIPMAYNAQLISNQIKHDQQRMNLEFYKKLIAQYSQLQCKAVDYVNKIDQLAEDHSQASSIIDSSFKNAEAIVSEHSRYRETLSQLQNKKKVIIELQKELSLTEHDKQLLLSSEEDAHSQDTRKAQHRLEMKRLQSIDTSEDQEELLFERFKQDFFKALTKLNHMQEVGDLLSMDSKGSKLAQSITENVKFVEESSYAKLVKHLREKMRMFDTPLENQPQFLIFMKVTMKLLSQKSSEMYAHIVNELIKSRQKYIELSYNEKMSIIFSKESQSSGAKIVAQILAWLHETLVNEVEILNHTSLDESQFLEAFNSIFSRSIAKSLKQKLDTQIGELEDFPYAFEMYFMLSSFMRVMKEHFVKKLNISKEEDLTDTLILSFFSDLKDKSMQKLVECSEQFLSKMYNLFYSHESQSTLQIERYIKLTVSIFDKLIAILLDDKDHLEVFRKRIFAYAITRVLPSTETESIADHETIQIANSVLLFNYFDSMGKLLTKDLIQQRGFKDQNSLINDRTSYMTHCLKLSAVKGFEKKESYQQLICSYDLKEFGIALDDLQEDLQFQDSSSPLKTIQQGISNSDMRQLIVELAKEEIMSKLRESLEYAVEGELQDIASKPIYNDEERERLERVVRHVEYNLTERLESVKKRIVH